MSHVREELGAFLLGALDAVEAERVREHMATCPECRHAHERLAGVPSLLALVDTGAPEGETPPPALERAVLRGYEQHRPARGRGSRWRPPLRAASAGALAGAAVTIGVLALTGVISGDDTVRVRLAGAGSSPATATATLRSVSGGTRVALEARDLPATRGAEVYEAWFVREGGRVSAGTFTVAAGRDAELELTTAARAGDYRRLGVTREPDGLDPARNGPNVLAGVIAPG